MYTVTLNSVAFIKGRGLYDITTSVKKNALMHIPPLPTQVLSKNNQCSANAAING